MPPRAAFFALATAASAALVACAFTLEEPVQGDAGGTLDGSVTTSADGGTSADGAGQALDAGAACDADLARDPNHCGACGTSCGSLACAGGQCVTTTLASGLGAPRLLALDPQAPRLYFTDGPAVLYVPLDGLAQPVPVATLGGAPYDLAVGALVYATLNDQLLTMPRDGTDAGAATLSSTQGAAYGVATDGTSVYYAGFAKLFQGGFQKGDAPGVVMCAATSCASPPPAVGILQNSRTPNHVVLHGGVLFVDEKNTSSNAIWKCAAPGPCAPFTQLDSEPNATAFAVDDTDVYIAASDGASPPNVVMFRCAVAGCTAPGARVASWPGASPASIALDAKTVYAAAGTGVVAVDKASGAVTTFAGGFTQIGAVLVDAYYVYVADTGGGTVQRLPK